MVDCVPQCDGRSCGDNGCGEVCGDCAQGESCLAGECVTGCVPNCAGRRCGDDGCGGRCAVFGDPEIVTFDANAATNVEAPTNVPPTRPTITIEPAEPNTEDALTCVIASPSYDLDPVTYRYRWFRDGVFAKDVGDAPTIAAGVAQVGEDWTCRVRASDGIEWSIPTEAETNVSAP